MSVKFCKYCNNLLDAIFNNEEMVFRCNMCNNIYHPFPIDTLRYERVKENSINLFENILNKAVDDPVSLKERVDCVNSKCNGKIVKQVRVGNDMKLFNICTTCKTQWLN